MTLQKMAASAGLAATLATAGWGLAATAGTPAAAASTTAANASPTASPTTRPVSSQDRMFMDEVSQINLAEVSLGKYMQAHGTTTTVKDLGATYAHDHAAAQADLRALASRLHVTVPATPGPKLESMMAQAESLTGRSLDVTFVKASVSGHKAGIAIFRQEESAGSNPAVKAYATHYLPMMQRHLRLAEHAESVMHIMPAK